MTELSFKGKEFVYNHHLAVPFRPLVPDETKGIGPVALDGNLIIHGDNLHALKALLPLYAGKVDCIFIDPPYNTGNEGWAYNDNVNAPMIKEWLESNPVGIEDGLRHDKWCAMMWPRLRLLHELLADTGSLWVTLDNNEVAKAITLLDEIFGENNRIEVCIWQKNYSPKPSAKYFSSDHDYVLVYAKRKENWSINLLGRTEEMNARYSNPDNDPRGPWKPGDCSARNYYSEGTYRIVCPGGRVLEGPPPGRYWTTSEENFWKADADNRVWWGEDKNNIPAYKQFLSEVKDGRVPQTLWFYDEVGHTQDAKKEINAIMQFVENEDVFITPKPRDLLLRVLELATHRDSLVLDSFAGSGTTAHAVLEANKRDGGSRRFILVEMEDYADRLTAERVRRVINGYDFKGTQKTELLRERLNWRSISNAADLVHKVEAIENLHGHEYDRIRKEVKDGELIVTGEKTVAERAEGLGGTFTYCTLGDPVELDKVLSGETLPPYAGLGAALFHMATNHALDPATVREDDFYLGATEGQHVWLIYKPDLDWLKSPEAALTLARAKAFAAADPDKRHLVFAPARFVSQKMLAEQNIPVEFVPLPFALYRIDRS
ncbi:site-specific DNA-methyltransferase [Paracoccus pantotrophus]|uniref:site-specific DNA-methyltransferase (adenine-specific) n=1 Tax=Paracoccus pantotrophus TaxID=82367 RepID=A0A7H9BY83_PARPN|nr:site-specific DNA-methyltransferase [Paracoccus pantotrophus]QLH16019.1 site-specific DNA-methyltransferase [Paracoccus pantotrophus]